MNKKPLVLGKNVYVNIPEKEENKIIVDANTKEALAKELLLKLKKLEIWAIGDAANPKLKVGQMVLIDPAAITRAKMVEFDDGITRALVLDYDIVHIWP
jgi:hypothetical protein